MANIGIRLLVVVGMSQLGMFACGWLPPSEPNDPGDPGPSGSDGSTPDGGTGAPDSGTDPDKIVTISVGFSHLCRIHGDGGVTCMGGNESGQLGNNSRMASQTPVAVRGLAGRATAVTAGFAATCAVVSGGTAQCWGRNLDGQLGNGTTQDSLTAVTVEGLSGVTAIALGRDHACAIVAAGAVRCWGYNGSGALGNGALNTPINALTPVPVLGLTGAVAISAGPGFACALLGDGTVRCWGDNFYGELGNGTRLAAPTPVQVIGIAGAIALSSAHGSNGAAPHICALLADHTARCWGYNGSGGLGDDSTTDAPVPVAVAGVSDIVEIATGSLNFTCVRLRGGTLECWGENGFHQLGNGLTTRSLTPVPVAISGLGAATVLSSGYSRSCAVFPDGTSQCWGDS